MRRTGGVPLPLVGAFVGAVLLVGQAHAWVASTLPAPQGSDRGPALVFAPSSNPTGRSGWTLPVVMLLHGRCQSALTADTGLGFIKLVDQVRSFPARPLPAELEACLFVMSHDIAKDRRRHCL